MVKIVGPGGIGKSRLALAVTEGARERCPDGISYIDLAPLTEPSLVLPTIAKSLGIGEQTGTRVSNPECGRNGLRAGTLGDGRAPGRPGGACRPAVRACRAWLPAGGLPAMAHRRGGAPPIRHRAAGRPGRPV